MADRQIYELTTKTAKHKAVDTVVSSTSTDEMTKSTHELFLATELNPISAPVSTTHKALPFNPLRGRAVVANSTNTKAYGVRPVDLGQESVAIDRQNNRITAVISATDWEKMKPNKNSFSFGFYLPRYPITTTYAIRVLHFNDQTNINGFRLLLHDAPGGRGITLDAYKSDGSVASNSPTLLNIAKSNANPYLHIVVDRNNEKIFYYIDNIILYTT